MKVYCLTLYSNTASNNTAVGYKAGYTNGTGAANLALGNLALYSNTTANHNVAAGYVALYSNTTGTFNVGLGSQALYSNTTAERNTAVGYQAGYTPSTSNENTFVGYKAGYTKTTGDANTFIGNIAGTAATTGVANTFVGSNSGSTVTTGTKNTILGSYNGNQGGVDIRTSNNNIVLSDGDGNPRYYYNTAHNLLGESGSFVAGCLSKGTGTQYYMDFRVGWTSNSSVGTQTGYISTNGTTTSYVTSSDYRLKNTIAPMTGALAKVALLKPCTYKWNANGSDGEGFIAHELAEVVPQCVTGEKDAVDAEGNPVYQGIDTSFLVATLTAAIQELKAEFDAYKATHP
jgi:hypothetical protein